MVKRHLALLLLVLIPGTVFAGSIRVEVERDTVIAGEPFRLSFIVEGSQDAEPDFKPLNKDFQLHGTGVSNSFSWSNGNVSSSKTYVLTVTAKKPGKITVPSIRFGQDKSPTRTLTVTAASNNPQSPSSGVGSRNDLFLEASVDTTSPYVQEQVILTVKIYRRIDWADANLSAPVFAGGEALVQPTGKDRKYRTTYVGEPYEVIERRYALQPQQDGKLTVNPFRLTARVPTGRKRLSPFDGMMHSPLFDDIFSRQTYAPVSVQSQAIILDVKPVPASFKGKHWLPAKDLKLHESWSDDSKKLEAGEPVTHTIGIIGEGIRADQLPEILLPDINNLKRYPDQAVDNIQVTPDGLLTSRTQKFALIAAAPGDYTLPGIDIPWWNTRTDTMEIARLPGKVLKVTGTAVDNTASVSRPQPGTQQAVPEALPDNPDTQSQPGKIADSKQPAVIQDTNLENTSRWLWAVIIVLAVLWIMTMVMWRHTRQKNTLPVNTDPVKAQSDPGRVRDRVINACASDDMKALHDALIAWARVVWEEQPPASLNDIARRVRDPLKEELMVLSGNLYGKKTHPVNTHIIQQEVLCYTSDTSQRQADEQSLEPLYR